MKAIFEAIAVCPACRAELIWYVETVVCRGNECGRIYQQKCGVPILDLSEDVGSIEDVVVEREPRSGLRRMLSRALRVKNTTYKTKASRDRQQCFIDAIGTDAIVLNIGSGTDDYGPRVVNLDVGPFQNVDVVGRSEWLPVRDGSVDAVITTGVLEHVGDLAASVAEIDRVLRSGGQVFHEVPFIQGFHGNIDHRRFTDQGAQALVRDYRVVQSGVALGPSSALVWLLSEWLGMVFSFGSQRVYHIAQRLFAKLVSPLRFFDILLEQRPYARMAACSLYVHAQKPASDTSVSS